jgi:hypothetical protein
MGIEPIANSLSPVESVGLTLLEDLIWAQKRGILRPSCAQIFPIAQNFGGGVTSNVASRAQDSAIPELYDMRTIKFAFAISFRKRPSRVSRSI